jgi:hypothetical protein
LTHIIHVVLVGSDVPAVGCSVLDAEVAEVHTCVRVRVRVCARTPDGA